MGSSARREQVNLGTPEDEQSGFTVDNKRASANRAGNGVPPTRQRTTNAGNKLTRREFGLLGLKSILFRGAIVATGGVALDHFGLSKVGEWLWPQYETNTGAYQGLRSTAAVALYISHGNHNLPQYMVQTGLAVENRSKEVVPTDLMSELLSYAEGHKRMDALLHNASEMPGQDLEYNMLLAYGMSRKCEEEDITTAKLNAQYAALRMIDAGFSAGESYRLGDENSQQQYAVANGNICNLLSTNPLTSGAVADAKGDAIRALAVSLQKL